MRRIFQSAALRDRPCFSGQGCVRWLATQGRNYYEVLGVDRNASPADIKKAFYTLSKKYHPDVVGSSNKAAADKFLEVKEAYDVLKDETQRRDYDQQLDHGYGAGPQSSYQQYGGREYYQHVRRQSPYERSSTYSQEDFHRIWQAMQNNKEFQRATKDFDEYLRKAREHVYNDYAKRRETRFRNYSEEEMRKRSYGRSFRNMTELRNWNLIKNVLAVYFSLFVLASLYQYFRQKPVAPPFQDISAPKSQYDRINEMINRPPRY